VTAILAAYCTDSYLVILTSGKSLWATKLNFIPYAPGGTDSTGSCATGDSSVTSAFLQYRIPLNPTSLGSASLDNNKAIFQALGADGSDAGRILNVVTNVAYGVPTRGSIGVTTSGVDIYPVFNNRGTLTPEQCEVDMCNEVSGLYDTIRL
jgi:hypothetical protein